MNVMIDTNDISNPNPAEEKERSNDLEIKPDDISAIKQATDSFKEPQPEHNEKQRRRSSLSRVMGSFRRRTLSFKLGSDSSTTNSTHSNSNNESEAECRNSEAEAESKSACSGGENDPSVLPPMLKRFQRRNSISRVKANSWREELEKEEYACLYVAPTQRKPPTRSYQYHWELRRGPQLCIEEDDEDDDDLLNILRAASKDEFQ